VNCLDLTIVEVGNAAVPAFLQLTRELYQRHFGFLVAVATG
jgi:hypothetical protein